MSIRATTLVWERTRAKGSNLLMLLAIADYAKDDGRWAWPSVRTLTWKTRLTGRGGELILRKLVEDGEVWPEWNAKERHLYLHLRCVMDWATYQTEGPIPDREKIARNQSESFSRRLIELACAKANGDAPKAKNGARKAKNRAASLCSGSEGSVRSEEQGLRPDSRPVQPVENPEDSVRVVTKIAHEVLDLYAQTADVDLGDIVEAVKRHCAVLDIAYAGDVVQRAIESALYQRQRAGKPSVIAGSSGESAFRLQSEAP